MRSILLPIMTIESEIIFHRHFLHAKCICWPVSPDTYPLRLIFLCSLWWKNQNGLCACVAHAQNEFFCIFKIKSWHWRDAIHELLMCVLYVCLLARVWPVWLYACASEFLGSALIIIELDNIHDCQHYAPMLGLIQVYVCVCETVAWSFMTLDVLYAWIVDAGQHSRLNFKFASVS